MRKIISMHICLIFLTLPIIFQVSLASAQQSDDDFQLIILSKDFYDLELDGKTGNVFPILDAIDSKDNLIMFNLNKIEIYNWDRQTSMLAKEASAVVLDVLSRQVELKDEIEAFNSSLTMMLNHKRLSNIEI